MKSLFITLLLLAFSFAGYAQSIDERIANAMNKEAWRELRELYLSEGSALQTPYLHPLSKFFLHHFYNQPDSALHYGRILLNEHQQELGTSVSSIVYFMANDYARSGDFKNGAEILHQMNEAMRTAGAEVSPPLNSLERQYQILDSLGGFSVSKPKHDAIIPLRFYQDDRSNPVMLYAPVEMNGVKEEITYDTGAGVNVISPATAKRIGAKIFDTPEMSMTGTRSVATSQLAIVDSIRLGEILYRNVPFLAKDFLTGHEKADENIKDLNLHCVLGSQLMLPLGEIQFDFANRQLIVPAAPSPKPDYAPNLYYSSSNAMMLSVFDKKSGQVIDANLDTGASETELLSSYYNRNQFLFTDITADTLRGAGMGGVIEFMAFKHLWDYKVGNISCTDSVLVITTPGHGALSDKYDCLFGLPTLAHHDRVTINFKDMWVGFVPTARNEEKQKSN